MLHVHSNKLSLGWWCFDLIESELWTEWTHVMWCDSGLFDSASHWTQHHWHWLPSQCTGHGWSALSLSLFSWTVTLCALSICLCVCSVNVYCSTCATDIVKVCVWKLAEEWFHSCMLYIGEWQTDAFVHCRRWIERSLPVSLCFCAVWFLCSLNVLYIHRFLSVFDKL